MKLRAPLLLFLLLFAGFSDAAGQTSYGRLDRGPLGSVDRDVAIHTVTARAGDRVVVQVSSREFDPILRLISPSGGQWENNDFADGTTDARIEVEAEVAGVWRVEVSSLYMGAGGAYTLRAGAAPVVAQPRRSEPAPRVRNEAPPPAARTAPAQAKTRPPAAEPQPVPPPAVDRVAVPPIAVRPILGLVPLLVLGLTMLITRFPVPSAPRSVVPKWTSIQEAFSTRDGLLFFTTAAAVSRAVGVGGSSVLLILLLLLLALLVLETTFRDDFPRVGVAAAAAMSLPALLVVERAAAGGTPLYVRVWAGAVVTVLVAALLFTFRAEHARLAERGGRAPDLEWRVLGPFLILATIVVVRGLVGLAAPLLPAEVTADLRLLLGATDFAWVYGWLMIGASLTVAGYLLVSGIAKAAPPPWPAPYLNPQVAPAGGLLGVVRRSVEGVAVMASRIIEAGRASTVFASRYAAAVARQSTIQAHRIAADVLEAGGTTVLRALLPLLAFAGAGASAALLGRAAASVIQEDHGRSGLLYAVLLWATVAVAASAWTASKRDLSNLWQNSGLIGITTFIAGLLLVAVLSLAGVRGFRAGWITWTGFAAIALVVALAFRRGTATEEGGDTSSTPKLVFAPVGAALLLGAAVLIQLLPAS